MSIVFISYRRSDTAGHAGRIYEQLVKHFSSQGVFLDTGSVQPGAIWNEALERTISEAPVMLCLIGQHWNTENLFNPGDFIRKEIELALSVGHAVIP